MVRSRRRRNTEITVRFIVDCDSKRVLYQLLSTDCTTYDLVEQKIVNRELFVKCFVRYELS